jgi:hypothetical protein
MNTIFSHRPLAGVSVGAYSVDGTLYVAFALVNDGISRKGFLHEDHVDSFVRKEARSVINSRIRSVIKGNHQRPLVMSFDTEMTGHEFMKDFREVFKPTVDETDDFLSEVGNFAGVEVRTRADNIVERITQAVNGVIVNASTSV